MHTQWIAKDVSKPADAVAKEISDGFSLLSGEAQVLGPVVELIEKDTKTLRETTVQLPKFNSPTTGVFDADLLSGDPKVGVPALEKSTRKYRD